MTSDGDCRAKKILLIDPDRIVDQAAVAFLERQGLRLVRTDAVEPGQDHVGRSGTALVLAAIPNDGTSTAVFLQSCRALAYELPVIVISRRRLAEDASEAFRAGAFDYIPAPLEDHRMLGLSVERALEGALRAEQAAASLSERLLVAIDTLTENVAIYDSDDRLFFCNEAFRHTNRQAPESLRYGVSFEEHIRKLMARGMIPEAEGREEDWLRMRSEHHRKPHSVLQMDRQDGLSVLARDQALPDGGRIVTASDVTRLKRARDALERSEARFREFAEISSDWLWEMDENLRFTFVSDRLRDITGLDPAERIGKSRKDVSSEETSSEAWQAHMEVLRRREPFRNFTYEIGESERGTLTASVNGSPVFDQDGKFRGYRGTGTDISKQRRAEQKLRQSEQLLRSFLESSPDPSSILDLEGRYLAANRALGELFDLDPEEIVGKTAREAFGDTFELYDEVWAQEQEVVETDSVVRREITISTSSADDRVHVITKFPIHDELGRVFRVGTSSQDVTEVRRLETQLRQSQKMEAVGQLTGGVAHDFNNLLGIMIGNLELALDEIGASNDPARRSVKRVLQAAERGASLTQRLLAYSRKQALMPRPIRIEGLIDGMHDLLRRSLGETVEVAVACAPDLWLTEVDPAQLENSVLNLAINARDALSVGGNVTIEADNVEIEESDSATKPEIRSGSYVMLAVSDNGSGIAPDVLDRVFEPFFTTKDVGQGSGLGLSMVIGFARQSGGTATIYSELGVGTTVKLYLPRYCGEAAEATVAVPLQTVEASPGGETILLVEDDADLRELFVNLLGSLGYTVHDAATARDALDMLDRGVRVDLLLTDVVLPGGIDGRMLSQEVQKLRPSLPTLFMSGYTENGLLRDGRIEPDVHLLQKPFRKAEIARAVRERLDSARADPLRKGAQEARGSHS